MNFKHSTVRENVSFIRIQLNRLATSDRSSKFTTQTRLDLMKVFLKEIERREIDGLATLHASNLLIRLTQARYDFLDFNSTKQRSLERKKAASNSKIIISRSPRGGLSALTVLSCELVFHLMYGMKGPIQPSKSKIKPLLPQKMAVERVATLLVETGLLGLTPKRAAQLDAESKRLRIVTHGQGSLDLKAAKVAAISANLGRAFRMWNNYCMPNFPRVKAAISRTKKVGRGKTAKRKLILVR